jgi:hypothetical protein
MAEGEKAVKVAAGDQHSAVVTNKGTLFHSSYSDYFSVFNHFRLFSLIFSFLVLD